jgi:hypothetical protein
VLAGIWDGVSRDLHDDLETLEVSPRDAGVEIPASGIGRSVAPFRANALGALAGSALEALIQNQTDRSRSDYVFTPSVLNTTQTRAFEGSGRGGTRQCGGHGVCRLPACKRPSGYLQPRRRDRSRSLGSTKVIREDQQ